MTPEDIYSAIIKYEDKNDKFHRWLGASLIGHSCTRCIALSFACAFHNNFTGRIRRVFENGHKAEERIVRDIELAGAKVFDQQLEIDAPQCLGHAGSTIDGKVEENGEVMLLELKTAKATDFKKYVKTPIKESNPRYYAQVQVNMHLTKTKKALWVVENKDSNELHLEYVDYDEQAALHYLDIMKKVIDGWTGIKLSENPDYYECRWCAANSICHGKKVPRMHCLTCCHCQPIEGGVFMCNRYKNTIPQEHLPKGCEEHVFHPDFINLPMVDNGEYWISYRLPDGKLIINCAGMSFPNLSDDELNDIVTSEEWSKRGVLYDEQTN